MGCTARAALVSPVLGFPLAVGPPTRPVSVVGIAATEVADSYLNIIFNTVTKARTQWTYADEAADSLTSVLNKNRSMICTTPFVTGTSGCTILAVTLPDVTKVPVLFVLKVRGSPPAVVIEFEERLGLYTVVPFTI